MTMEDSDIYYRAFTTDRDQNYSFNGGIRLVDIFDGEKFSSIGETKRTAERSNKYITEIVILPFYKIEQVSGR